MALFEFEDGHLVPAQFGYPVASELDPELVDAVDRFAAPVPSHLARCHQ